MSYTRSLVTIVFIALVAMILGCSGGANPTIPGKTTDSMDSVPIIGLTDTNDTFNAVGLMGAYELTINPTDLSAELVNKRVSSIGEDYIVSGIAFFTIAPCADCLQLVGISLPGGTTAVLTFEISHPFEPGNTSEDPTAKNRLDLDVFDLAAVIMPGGDPAPTATTYTLTGDGIYTGFCVDPHGYTCELAEVITDDNALPYFLVVDDCVTEDPPAATFNRFAMGDSVEFDIAFDMTSGTLGFDLYLTMGYGASAKKPQRLDPKYYNPEFNRKAAWKVDVTPPEGENPPVIGNTWQDNDLVTLFDVTVDVYDWQIGATVSAEEDFADADAGDVFAASEPASVTVEVPGMNTTLPEATAPVDPLATGEPGDPWIFTVGVANENGLAAGTYLGLVKVTDARPALTPDDGRDFLIDTVDGIVLENYEMPEYATYQTFPATVVVGCGPITGSITSPACPVTTLSSGSSVDFVVTAASGNGGDPVVLYEVDFDYDGSTFTMDDSNTDGNFVGVGPFINPNCGTPPEEPVTFTVAFRATDSCTPANETIFATCDVTVDICCVEQSLLYDFEASGGGWTGGGCGLPNTDSLNWGHFCWGCTASGSCISGGSLTTGGDGTGCGSLTDHYTNADFNIVSVSINLPAASDTTIEFNHCNAFATGAEAFLYISLNGCAGPWTQIWSTTTASECISDETVDISSYSGTDVMFRFRYTSSNYTWSGGSCGNAGIAIDDVEISGCFSSGTLEEN